MKQIRFFLVSFLFILAGGPLQGWAIGQDEFSGQCPQADKYRLQRSFYFSNLKEVVRAPQSPDEIKARLAELNSTEKWRRQAAIASLALAGNLDLFHQLLAEGDGDGMATYAGNYLREDGNLCIDPQIEKAIVRNFADSRFTSAFLSFFHKNLYSNPEIFELLAPLQLDTNDPDQYGRIIKALCATRLAGLDEQMLEIGTQALLHETPVQKRVMPGVHQSIIAYLASQKSPAFSYYRTVFATEHRGERVAYFQNNYAQTRLAIYQALVHYSDDASFLIFLEQLNELSREAWGPFYVNDLNHLLTNLKAHSRFEENKNKVIPFLRQILSTPSLPQMVGYSPPWERAGDPAFYDQKIRKQVYALLVEIDTGHAANLFLSELGELLRRPQSEGQKVLVTELLHGLASLSASTPIDQERLVVLANRLTDQTQIVKVSEILGSHHHPTGFHFVMGYFEGSIRKAEENQDAAVSNRLADILFNILLQFSDSEYLLKTRNKIDTLFLEEKIEEARYHKMSVALSELLDTESATFTTLLETRKKEKEEKRRQELIEAQKKWRQEVEANYLVQSSPEGIDANIKALRQFGGEAKKAAYWLIRIGKPILPKAHEALSDPEATTELKMQLMIVLGEIGDESSVPFIIEAAKTEPANITLFKDAFLSLGRLPQTSESITFANEVLESQEGIDRHKMSALAYFAIHRDQQGLKWSKRFSGEDVSPPLRAAALYLAAMVGEEKVAKQIVKMLKGDPEKGVQHILWRGLAEISSYKEYREIANKFKLEHTAETKQMDQYVRFRASSGMEKIELATELLTAKTPLYAETAIRFLLEKKKFDLLGKYFQGNGPYDFSLEMVLFASSMAQRIFSEARRQGYTIEEKEVEIVFKAAP